MKEFFVAKEGINGTCSVLGRTNREIHGSNETTIPRFDGILFK